MLACLNESLTGLLQNLQDSGICQNIAMLRGFIRDSSQYESKRDTFEIQVRGMTSTSIYFVRKVAKKKLLRDESRPKEFQVFPTKGPADAHGFMNKLEGYEWTPTIPVVRSECL